MVDRLETVNHSLTAKSGTATSYRSDFLSVQLSWVTGYGLSRRQVGVAATLGDWSDEVYLSSMLATWQTLHFVNLMYKIGGCVWLSCQCLYDTQLILFTLCQHHIFLVYIIHNPGGHSADKFLTSNLHTLDVSVISELVYRKYVCSQLYKQHNSCIACYA